MGYPFGDVNHTQDLPEVCDDGCVKTPLASESTRHATALRDSATTRILLRQPPVRPSPPHAYCCNAGSSNQTHTAAAVPITSSSLHISIVLPAVWCATSALQGHIFLQGGLAKLTSHACSCAGPTCNTPGLGMLSQSTQKKTPRHQQGCAWCYLLQLPAPLGLVQSYGSPAFTAPLAPQQQPCCQQVCHCRPTTPTSSTQEDGPGRQGTSRSSPSHVLETSTKSPVVHSIHM